MICLIVLDAFCLSCIIDYTIFKPSIIIFKIHWIEIHGVLLCEFTVRLILRRILHWFYAIATITREHRSFLHSRKFSSSGKKIACILNRMSYIYEALNINIWFTVFIENTKRLFAVNIVHISKAKIIEKKPWNVEINLCSFGPFIPRDKMFKNMSERRTESVWARRTKRWSTVFANENIDSIVCCYFCVNVNCLLFFPYEHVTIFVPLRKCNFFFVCFY